MRYLLVMEVKEPFEENWKKAMEIMSERRQKGETWGKESLLGGNHRFLSAARKGMNVVDTSEAKIAKYIAAYESVLNIKFSPIMHSVEWEKAIK